MRKRKSVWISLIMIFVLTFSFSLSVYAYPESWVQFSKGTSATVNRSLSDAAYYVINHSSQYIKSDGSYFTGQYRYYYWRLATLGSPHTWESRFRVNRLSVSVGTSSGSGGVAPEGKAVFFIGSTSEILQGDAVSVPFGSGGTYYFDSTGDYVYLWVQQSVWYSTGGTSSPSLTVNSITYSFDSVEYTAFGSGQGINTAINETTSAINKQTNSVNSSINNQTNSINNTITEETRIQTDTLTNGFDGSGMDADNNKLASSMSSYEDAESQLTDKSVGYIDAVTFFDPTKHLQLMSCITYTSTFLQNLFVALGDWSVLISISLSISFALMLIGWYKYRK